MLHQVHRHVTGQGLVQMNALDKGEVRIPVQNPVDVIHGLVRRAQRGIRVHQMAGVEHDAAFGVAYLCQKAGCHLRIQHRQAGVPKVFKKQPGRPFDSIGHGIAKRCRCVDHFVVAVMIIPPHGFDHRAVGNMVNQVFRRHGVGKRNILPAGVLQDGRCLAAVMPPAGLQIAIFQLQAWHILPPEIHPPWPIAQMHADDISRGDHRRSKDPRLHDLEPVQAVATEKRPEIRPVRIAARILRTGGDIHYFFHWPTLLPLP